MWEVVEICPYCMNENYYVWDPEKKNYVATCSRCGKKIFLCDACRFTDDNPKGYCDFYETEEGRGCFRGWIKEGE